MTKTTIIEIFANIARILRIIDIVGRGARSWSLVLGSALLVVIATTGNVAARQGNPPLSSGNTVLAASNTIDAVQLPSINAAALRDEAAGNTQPGPLKVAEGIDIAVGLDDGTWENVGDGRVWRVRIDSPGAFHLNFGFGTLGLPPGATLHVIGIADESAYVGPYTSKDQAEAGLWTPMVPGDSAVIEIFVPHEAPDPVLEITRVGQGIVDLFNLSPAKHELQGCHIDVICPQSFMDNEERSVARLLINNAGLCTGTLINDVGGTLTPYILTANHCGITAALAPTVVALFNFKTAACGSATPGPTTDTVSGSVLRASRVDVDGTLLQMNNPPPQNYNSYLAGWDNSNAQPLGTTGIHHPQGTSMAFADDTNPPVTINNCIGGGGVNSHWQSTWTLGTTLQGSSGSALFDRGSSRVIGHLSGGSAACNGTQPNGLPDCYGKFAVFWDGPTADSRLRDWLDPGNTGAMTVNGIENGGGGGCQPDAFEADDNQGQAKPITAGVTKNHNICPAGDVDWSSFTLAAESAVTLTTSGAAGDTVMWLRNQAGAEIDFDDDGGTNLFSMITRACNVDALPAGNYFVQVQEFGGNQEIAAYALDMVVQPCGGGCQADITLANQVIGGTQAFRATNSATLGQNLTINGTNVTVEAPTVTFVNNTEIGGTFFAGNTPNCI